MPTFHAIAAMSETRVIADQGKLPWHLPDEYRWFKHKTIGGTLIMGRKTREAIGRALPRRTNLVLSRGKLEMPETICYSSVDQLLAALDPDQTIWVVGGAEIYRLFLPRCTFLYLSRIKGSFSGDVFFPPFEDQFSLNQVIHENADFRVERWLNNNHADEKFAEEACPRRS
jgi:dihydrofolate reductase